MAIEKLTRVVMDADIDNCSVGQIRTNLIIVSLILSNVSSFVLNQQFSVAFDGTVRLSIHTVDI